MRDAPKQLLEDLAQAHVMPLLNLFWDGLRYNTNWLEIAQRSLVAAWVVSETSHFLNQYSMGLNFTLLEACSIWHSHHDGPFSSFVHHHFWTIEKGARLLMVTPVCESFTYLQHLLRHPSRWKLMR